MTIVIGKRQALGGLATFILGALVAVAAILPATSAAGSVQTRYASCAGLDFYPTDSQTQYDNFATLRVRRYSDVNKLGTGIFRCDPGLPNGAVVKQVQVTGLLWLGTGMGDCALVRSSLAQATPTTYQDLGRVTFPTAPAPTGAYRMTTSSIQNATIDNSSWGYWLECSLTSAFGFGATTRLSGLYGADVVYTITAAKG